MFGFFASLYLALSAIVFGVFSPDPDRQICCVLSLKYRFGLFPHKRHVKQPFRTTFQHFLKWTDKLSVIII